MTTKGEGSIGALDYSENERKILAKKSPNFVCTCCGCIKELVLKDKPSTEGAEDGEAASTSTVAQETQELVKQIKFESPSKVAASKKSETPKQSEKEKKKEEPSTEKTPLEEKKEEEAAAVRGSGDDQNVPSPSLTTVATDETPPVLAGNTSVAATPSTPADPSVSIMQRRQRTNADTVIDVSTHFIVIVLAHLVAYLVIRRLGIIFDYSGDSTEN